jgi:hypothetical protein
MLTPQEKSVLLELQRYHPGMSSSLGKFALGDILLADGQITRTQLDSALLSQRASGRRLGEELIEAGHVSRRQVELSLLLQKKFIAYALVLATTVLPLSPFMPSAQSAQHVAAMPVSAQVVANAKLHTSYQATQIEISAADVARGWVEAPVALRFSVATNKGAGFVMQFNPIGNIFESVQIAGLGNSAQLGSDGGVIVQRTAQASDLTHELSFSFTLRPGTTPGTYPWPLSLSVRAL